MRSFWQKMVLLLCLALCYYGCLWACGQESAGQEDVLDEPGQSALYSGGEIVLVDQADQEYAAITVSIPDSLYQDIPDGGLRQAVSDQLEQAAQAFIDSRQAEDAAQRQADPSYQAEHRMDCALFYGDDTLVSIRAELYDGVRGASHPLLTVRGYTFGPDGERLDLADLLGADYQQTAPAAILAQLEAAGERDNYYPDLEQLLPQGLAQDKWYADEGQVYLVYDPYEIAAYAMGSQEFPVERQ